MKPLLLASLLLVSACQAQGVGRVAGIQIVDRDTGAVLTPYRHHGEYWVAGRPGARYSIRVQNHRGQRVLAVTTVDGINVITGTAGGWNQSGYVFAPGESYEIAGWRKSDEEIAAFEFTASPNSYAARTGRPANIGVVGLALFVERSRPVEIPEPQRYSSEDGAAANAARGQDEAAERREAPAAAPEASGSMPSRDKATLADAARAPSPKLGTGHGAREYSHVDTTTFDKQSETPNEIIRIRYDSYENLVAMGVAPRRWRAVPAPAPNPFPDSPFPQYVPDPPGGG